MLDRNYYVQRERFLWKRRIWLFYQRNWCSWGFGLRIRQIQDHHAADEWNERYSQYLDFTFMAGPFEFSVAFFTGRKELDK